MIVGDLPPYEAFPIGGTNSVRGYSEGGVGSGRNYGAGTAELHFPLFKPLQVLPKLAGCMYFPSQAP
jgi:outer membrane protein assembly factor BamA